MCPAEKNIAPFQRAAIQNSTSQQRCQTELGSSHSLGNVFTTTSLPLSQSLRCQRLSWSASTCTCLYDCPVVCDLLDFQLCELKFAYAKLKVDEYLRQMTQAGRTQVLAGKARTDMCDRRQRRQEEGSVHCKPKTKPFECASILV